MKPLLWMSLWLLLASSPGAAQGELDQLLASGELRIDSRLDHDGMLVPGQRARMQIEVATSTWFTGGTRIRLPEVPGLVILQTDQFAANASESREGKTWVVQRWSIDLYPQRAGDFVVPAMTLSLKVNGGNMGDIEGEAQSPPLAFSVRLPPSLEQANFWVASPDYAVEQLVSRATDALKPGDAFERTITFEATDVLAMMLPEVTEGRQPGLAAYPAPPQLDNRNNRGQSSGKRVQTITYLAEQPGNYRLPAREFFWWDTSSETLQVLSLPSIDIHVIGETGEGNRGVPGKTGTAFGQRMAAGATMLLSVLVVAALLYRYRPWRFLATFRGPVQALWQRLRDLRKPALPRRLNPDSSAGD